MNRLRKNALIGLLLLFTVVFNGCIDVVEEIVFKKDGSGNYVMNFDMSKMMSMLGGMDIGSMLGGEEGEAAPKDPQEKKDPIVVDTTISFKSMIAERGMELDRADLWEKVVMKMKMDQTKGIMRMKIAFDFDNAEDINYIQSNLGKLSQDEGGASGVAPGLDGLMGMMNTGTDKIAFKKRTFTRSSTPKEKSEKSENDEMAQQMEMMKMFMADASYKTIYRFPRRVKSVSNKNSKIADDKKTVVTELNFLELMDGKVKTDNKIKLKRR